jgi:hypothetical protein
VGDFGPIAGAATAVRAAGVGSSALAGTSRRARMAMASLRASSALRSGPMSPIRCRWSFPSAPLYLAKNTFLPVGSTRRMNPGRASHVIS